MINSLSKKFKKTKDIFFMSYTCSGATFFENIIIELGIRLKFEQEKKDGDFFKFVRKLDRNTDEYLKTDHLIPSQFGIPTLANQDKFNFRNDIAVFFTHNADFFSDSQTTFILIRDPRDTLLSNFRTTNQEDPKLFFEFCQANVSSWINFYTRALSYKHFHMVRFEDLKLNSFFTLRSLMASLGLKYEDNKLYQAIDCSTFAKTKEAEDRMITKYPEIGKAHFPNRITKSGKCYQYKLEENSHLKESFSLIEDKASELISKFGYNL